MKIWAALFGLFCLALALQGCAERRGDLNGAAAAPDPAAAKRGEYLYIAGNCGGCHGKGEGGRAIATAFGTFYSRNITPDPAHGIGRWSDKDFIRALRDGVSPEGEYYFPAFPFTSFTGMSDRDILDLRAYLTTLAPSSAANRPADTILPRAAMALWRGFYFTPGPWARDPSRSEEWNRGAYLANAVAHCGECHTPRDALGGMEIARRFAGGKLADNSGKDAPNLTPARLGAWRVEDFATVLETGMKPDGDFVAKPMSEVAEATAKLTPADRRAIAAYIKSLPPKN